MHPHAVQGPPFLAGYNSDRWPYCWGFPFSLQVSKNERWVILHTKDDLPSFLQTLGLEPVDFPDWRCTPDIAILSLPQPWLPVRCKRRSHGRKRLAAGSSPSPSMSGE